MEIRPVRTDDDHRAALAEIEACWGTPEDTEAGDKLDVLLALVDIYEAKRWPLETAARYDPVDVLRYAIDNSATPRLSLQKFWALPSVRAKFSRAGALSPSK
jgi:antitoxin component HigA of HigAB toxin-antitoxin module